MKAEVASEDGSPFRAASSGKASDPLAQLYKTTCRAISASRNKRSFSAIWARMAPTGNIYRFLGFRAEQSRHCSDLKDQLKALAAKHKELLGGDAVQPEEHVARLRDLLSQASRKSLPKMEEGEGATGFPALEEFVGGADSAVGAAVEAEAGSQWRTDHLMAVLVCTIQVVSPILIFVHNWMKDENQLRDPHKLYNSLTWKETMCMGESVSAALTTVMGTMMLVIINTIIFNYACAELENAEKLGRIPMDNFWLLCSTIANATCCLFISMAIPLEFWSEDGPTGIIMNAMALLFIFSFDDLSSDAFGYLDKDDSAFQQEVSWTYALLSHCPVSLTDLVDASAARPEDLWQVAYDSTGRLRTAGPEGGPCATRIALAEQGEDAPLMGKASEDQTLPDIRYQVRPAGAVRYLPGWRSSVSCFIWRVVVLAPLTIMWWVVPVVWFVVNKPCLDLHEAA